MFLFHGSSLSKAPLLAGSVLLAGALAMMGGASTTAAQDKVVKKAPIQQVDPTSGKAMYTSYCASCHGASGKGNGPAASELKVPPADLTQLAKNNKGEYPASHVWAILEFGAKAPAHGTNEMPVWGELFRALDPNDTLRTNLRTKNLVEYIKSLQAK